jgi:hypothetical protein
MSYYDDDTQRYIAENARVEHALLTPFRWLRNIAGFSLGCVVLLIMFTVNHYGWIVGLGERGLWGRDQIIEDLNDNTKEDGNQNGLEFNNLVVDFRVRGDDRYDWDYANQPYNPKAIIHYKFELTKNYDIKSNAMLAWDAGSNQVFTRLEDAPAPDTHPSSAANETELGPWDDRSNNSFFRKSARISRAYDYAVDNITALRTDITWYKTGEGSEYPESPTKNGYIEPDPQHVSKEAYERWTATSTGVKIPDAPVVRLKVVQTTMDLGRGYDADNPYGKTYLISGICILEACTEDDLNFHATWYADLFSKVPPLTPPQEEALAALIATGDEDFWLKTAHANGITDDALVKGWVAKQREASRYRPTSETHGRSTEVGLEPNVTRPTEQNVDMKLSDYIR